MSTIEVTNDINDGAHNEHNVHVNDDTIYEDVAHDDPYDDQPIEDHKERMERLETVSTMLAELIKDTQKQKSTNANENASMFKKFSSLNPPSYDGKPDPVEFEDWINRIDQLFETLQCPKEWRVDFAVFYLTGQASLWWKVNKERKNEPRFGWTELQKLLRDKFYPPSLRKQKEDEFLHLQQGTMSVMEYANKFMELSRFAPELVSTEQSRMNRFERGLHLKYQDRLATQRFTSYQDMVDIAVNVERVVLLREAQNVGDKRKNDNQNHGGAKRPNQGNHNHRRNDSRDQGYNDRATRKVWCAKCGKRNHTESECRAGTKTCYRCGGKDHFVRDCPKPPPTDTGRATSTNHERNNNNARVNHDPPRPPISGKAYMIRADKEEEDDANADTISI
ncbi:uncharacterized protein [Spinacia oleracea]|uniref:CCHC-type domain-containing protein n=1 Tax=Spinacia oleracea TaxID=3562 RepID=A0ABM3R7E8_SPIOL|nr:uncharacterized protein LOC130467106 [Spinacia oleracea]